jgi:hypothetical protein
VIVEYPDGSIVIVDFVVSTVEQALKAIAKGGINRRDLLEQAGLSAAEAEAELKHYDEGPSKADPALVESVYPTDEGPFGQTRLAE